MVMLAAAATVAGAEGRDGKCWHSARIVDNGQEWLNKEDANGYELAVLEGYGGGGSVYLMAVMRRTQR